jgi:hypothetical protein
MDTQGFWEFLYFPVKMDSNYFDYQLDYLDFIFPIVFLQTVLSALVMGFIFYNVLGNITIRLGSIVWWFIFMFLTAIMGFYFGFSKVSEVIYIDVDMGSDGLIFAVTNMVWAMILFFLGSLIFKFNKISTYSNHLPFVTPW